MSPKIIIRPKDPWWQIDWGEIFRFRELIWLFVRRDFVSEHKQTILGPLWFVLQPLGGTIVFTIIFGKVAKLGTDGIPPILFYNSGLIIWTYLQGSMNVASQALRANSQLFQKVYFPRLVTPLAGIIGKLWQLILNFSIFLCFMAYFLFFTESSIQPNLLILLFPLLVLQSAFIGLGFGLWIASLTIRYRDLHFAIPLLLQLWMYATPIVYPASLIPEKWRWVVWMNPMSSVVELNRYAFTGAGSISLNPVIFSWVVTIIVLMSGLFIFNKVQQTFIDTI